ncbi:NADH-dependent FMN reductase [Rhodococcus rhodnii]|nr:NADH-dependent FMN reductase [Rhodococcus rhodnii]
MLGDRIARKTAEFVTSGETQARVHVVELRALASEIASAIVSGIPGEKLQDAIDLLARADGVVLTTPVYKAGVSGLFKSFVDVLDNDLLIAKPVALAATAGTARHALVPDDQMRPLMAYMRALAVPTSVFAAPEDWGAPELSARIERVAGELAALVTAGVHESIRERSWGSYQHTFGSNAAAPDGDGIDLDTDMMRLAAGGGAT